MKKKREKLPVISSEHKEALGKLASQPEFKALLQLFKIEENNIIIQGFKINSSDPNIAIKKAHLEGRVYELRKTIRTFEECQKEKEE